MVFCFRSVGEVPSSFIGCNRSTESVLLPMQYGEVRREAEGRPDEWEVEKGVCTSARLRRAIPG